MYWPRIWCLLTQKKEQRGWLPEVGTCQPLQLAVPLQLQKKRGECSAIIKAGLGMYDKRWKLRPWWLLLPRWRPRNVISSPPHPPCVLESKGEYTAYIWIHGPWGTRYLLECQLWWVYPIFGQAHSHLGSESTYGSFMEHFAEICWVEVLIPQTFTHNHGTGSALHQRIKNWVVLKMMLFQTIGFRMKDSSFWMILWSLMIVRSSGWCTSALQPPLIPVEWWEWQILIHLQ